ncbi:exodeoxyribonuclease V subunit beta [Nocardioides euryhalodurans]|uniref:RecBCD enzyme subunit RecB n=1 Tax=Nocardioides euryhalodurans TaxID=2518370 RepID=A0A4P7GLL0_9ACTN|nr:exodeoxyribonuclease V subunit beta [Nocardioides euryhalodurans]QBR92704.1 exodeoxyribonuclease V subunit beta [Nocardioides euryhalodurans]
MAGSPTPFDLTGALPATGTTTVLEASAGTGKTFALAGLVTRYVAEGHARLDDMLLITFGRAASQELRERVRAALVVAADALDDPTRVPDDNALLRHLVDAPAGELALRRGRLCDALASFDSATIATTHQFCQLVLRSLGVAGDSEAGLTLVESLDDLVSEVVDDLYLARFRQDREKPPFSRAEAGALARDVVANPHTTLTPEQPEPGSGAAARVAFATEVLRELERRKRRLGVLGFDDLLSRLAQALADDDAPARQRMRDRWSIVMVDEFQDTDPVQWDVLHRAFDGASTLVLIGDPKQAIYAFRGGDIATYLTAAEGRDVRTLDTNWRSDQPLVAATHAVLRGASLGDDRIQVRDVHAHHTAHRLAGAPRNDPFRLRLVTRQQCGVPPHRTVGIDRLRDHISADLAADVKALLASDATYDGRPVAAGDVAVIVEAHKDARACRDALAAAGVPAVYTGDTDVFSSRAAADWLCLLEAFEQPQRSGLVRAAATTMFFGESAASLAAGGDDLTDRVAHTLREWADHARERGVAAVLEAAQVAGMGDRVLGWQGGERHLTDLAHLAQVLHETAHRERLGSPALLDWLRDQTSERRGAGERNRRLDSDAKAVQIMTVWVSKGLQYPLVYLPFAFNRHVPDPVNVLYHRGAERCLDIGGRRSGFAAIQALGRQESAGDDIRLTYVALTRAQSQVVAWWAPSWEEPHGGLSRLLRGRGPGEATVPEQAPGRPSDEEMIQRLRHWQEEGGPSLERSEVVAAPESPVAELPPGLSVRRFTRSIDTAWRRTSYSGLLRSAGDAVGVASEPEVGVVDDEPFETPVMVAEPPAAGAELPSPMADLPGGADFGSLVHGVLEEADPLAPDLEAELARHVAEQLPWWPVDATPGELAAALVPLHHSPLGPLLPELTLAQIGRHDRLRELDFEIPLAGGDLGPFPDIRVRELAAVLDHHLEADDPVRPYAHRLREPGLGDQSLRGYLSGSIDVVLRAPGPRYLVVDWKTNWLGEGEGALTAADYAPDRVREAMLHSDYPLQAMLYTVVLHRYLRWRQPGYDPEVHLGGVLYLYVRGMCGPDTPVVDGHPAGVFSWRPPAGLVTDLSDLLDGRRP